LPFARSSGMRRSTDRVEAVPQNNSLDTTFPV
jgi:hypothetical protein